MFYPVRNSLKRMHEEDSCEFIFTLRRRKVSPSIYLDVESKKHDLLSSVILKKGSKFKIPNLGKYGRTTDSQEHIAKYHAAMASSKIL